MPTRDEHFSAQFHRWEVRGRGWRVFPGPVFPAPPFRPFRFQPPPRVDDGRRPGLWSSLFAKAEPPPANVEAEDPEPTPLVREAIVELQATLPADLDAGGAAFAQLFRSLSYCPEPVAFELLGVHKKVVAQFAASPADAGLLRRQLAAFFPAAGFRAVPDALQGALAQGAGNEFAVLDFGLEREFLLPLATGKIDPFIGLVGALAGLLPGEVALYQVLWQPLGGEWAEGIVEAVTQPDGKPLFVNAPELTGAAENKVSQPLYAAVVRMLVRTTTAARLHEIAREFAGALCAFGNPQGNALMPLPNDGYPLDDHLTDVIQRQTRRTGMIVNAAELTGFVHLPSEAVQSPELLRDAGRTKAAPDFVRQPTGFCLGDNEHNGEVVPVFLSPGQRTRHTHLIGTTGAGKSSLLFNLMKQDIENGDGFALLDPHGDLAFDILGVIPDDRINDVIYFDPSDTDFPVGFNILQAHSEDEKVLLASDLIAVLRRFSTSWGDTMDAILHNAILAFLESTRGGTLADLREFLQNDQFRNRFLASVSDPEIVRFWRELFPQLGGRRSVTSVLMRLQDFFSRKPLRNIVSQRMNRLDFAQIMDGGKIFIARLPEGLNGAENTRLLGTLLAAKFQQTAMTRQSQTAADRRNFWLYVDEFDAFVAPSMAKILTETRKYRLGLTLAHQRLQALRDAPDVASAVLTQPCTRIVFNVGAEDARQLAHGFAFFDAAGLGALPKYHAAARVERNDGDFNLAVRKPEHPPEAEAAAQRERIIAKSRAKYATPRAEVEAAWLAVPAAAIPAVPPAPAKVPKPVIEPVVQPPPTIAETTAPRADAPAVGEVLRAHEPGRGSALHKAMQKRIAAAARAAGFDADAESQLQKGSQQAADVELRVGGTRIAVEIALPGSGTVNHEFENVQKCFKAGCARVAVVSTEPKRLDAIAAAVQGGLEAKLAERVGFHLADEFIARLPALAARFKAPPLRPGENTVDGIVVGSHFPPAADRAKEESLYRLVADILKARRPPPKR